MTGPQTENGYTPIAHEILENLVKLPLNGTQWRIITIVWRYTYGFSRKEHDISESFIAKATGINIRQVKREIKVLLDSNIFTTIKEATRNSTRVLAFNKHYDGWCLKRHQVTKKTPGDKLDTSRGGELDTSRGGKLDTQDKQKTKYKTTRQKKENPNSNLINFFCEEYKKKFGNAYIPNWARDGTIIKGFLESGYAEEHMREYIAWFMTCKDDYLDSNGRSIPLLRSRLDKYNTALKKEQSKYPDQSNYFKGGV